MRKRIREELNGVACWTDRSFAATVTSFISKAYTGMSVFHQNICAANSHEKKDDKDVQ